MAKKRISSALLSALLVVTAVLSMCSCSDSPVPETRDAFYFDTFVEISLYGCENNDEIFSRAFELCAHYDSLFSAYDENSELARLNASNGEPCELSGETVELIRCAIEYSQRVGGVFDITCGALTSLWDFTGEAPTPPQTDAIAAALKTVGYENVEIDNNTVTLKNGARLDLGGVAKGYVADRLKEELVSLGVNSAIINLGGNVLVVGDKLGEPFRVGVRSPFDSSGNIAVASVRDMSVVTAGSYERSFVYDGETYHHILDLSTGMPSQSGLASVTIFSKSSLDGDAYATSCFLLGAQDGLELVESLDGIEALFVTEDGELIRSSGCPC